jgi:hypothetical protein
MAATTHPPKTANAARMATGSTPASSSDDDDDDADEAQPEGSRAAEGPSCEAVRAHASHVAKAPPR